MCSMSEAAEQQLSAVSGLVASFFSGNKLINEPVARAVIKAETGRITVMSGSSKAQVMATESTPVSGTETRKEAVAPLLAPCLRKPTATGMTPQEHSGSGTPRAMF